MGKHIRVIAVVSYNDLMLKRLVTAGEILEVDKERAIVLCKAGCVKIYSIIHDNVEQ